MSDAAVQPPPGRVTVSAALAPDDVARVTALVDAAAQVDGVAPLSEHVMLHLLTVTRSLFQISRAVGRCSCRMQLSAPIPCRTHLDLRAARPLGTATSVSLLLI